MENEQITFIVPAYNAEMTLPMTIDSIVRQTCQNWKAIIVNDGSTDRTEVIGKQYEKDYPDKVRYLYQDNKGLGGARNHGMDFIDTTYIAFIDSDDWIKADFVRIIIEEINRCEDEKPEMILTLPEIYEENNKRVFPWYDEQLFYSIFSEDGICVNPQHDKRIYRTNVSQCRKVLRTDFIKRIKFRFREHVKWEDIYPHFYLMTHCKICMGIRSTGFYYRKGNEYQITASKGKERMDLIIVYTDLLPYLHKSDKELIYAVMCIIVGFANEGVKIADLDVCRELVIALYKFFKKVPRSCDRILYYRAKKCLKESEIRQYLIFLIVIRHKLLLQLFYDHLYRDASEQILKKMIRKLKRK